MNNRFFNITYISFTRKLTVLRHNRERLCNSLCFTLYERIVYFKIYQDIKIYIIFRIIYVRKGTIWLGLVQTRSYAFKKFD